MLAARESERDSGWWGGGGRGVNDVQLRDEGTRFTGSAEKVVGALSNRDRAVPGNVQEARVHEGSHRENKQVVRLS